MTPRWRTRLWLWGPVAVYATLIFVVSSLHIHPRSLFKSFTLSDKILHALEYALLCVLLFRALRWTRRPWLIRWAPMVALGLASLYGITDEWHQGLVGRDADVGDWVADTLGAALVAAILMVYTMHRATPRTGPPPNDLP